MTRTEFNQGVALLVGAVGKPMPIEQVQSWFVMFSDLTPEQFHAGIVQTIRTHEFHGFPPVAVIRKNALSGDSAALSSQGRSTIAWLAVKAAVASQGGYATVSFDDPIVNATIRMLGGWVRICDTEAGEAFDTWLRKDFERCYETLLSTGAEARLVAPVAGLIDIANSATGYEDRAKVAAVTTGLPEHGRKLVRGEPPPPTRIGQETRKLAVTLGVDTGESERPRLPPTPKNEQIEALKRIHALKLADK